MQEREQYKKIDLKPGELYIAEEPTVVWTVLGSCLSVVFYHESSKIGAICHAQLAEEKSRGKRCSDSCPDPCFQDSPDTNRFKYVTCSLRYMYEYFQQRDIREQEILVKLFGGGTMFPENRSEKSVGEENIEVAQKFIQDYGLRLISANAGGNTGRTLYFYSDTGEVRLRVHHPERLDEPGIVPVVVKIDDLVE